MPDDLFASSSRSPADYDARSIEVLEGLEPVRRRPGMYVGGPTSGRFTMSRCGCRPDIRSHAGGMACMLIAAEVIDNSMDEAGGGFATRFVPV